MPLVYSGQITVKKRLSFKAKETYSEEEVKAVEIGLKESLERSFTIDGDVYYDVDVSIAFVSPMRPLSHIVIPLADLRKAIADEMSAGITEMNLSNLLIFIRTIYRQDRD